MGDEAPLLSEAWSFLLGSEGLLSLIKKRKKGGGKKKEKKKKAQECENR